MFAGLHDEPGQSASTSQFSHSQTPPQPLKVIDTQNQLRQTFKFPEESYFYDHIHYPISLFLVSSPSLQNTKIIHRCIIN